MSGGTLLRGHFYGGGDVFLAAGEETASAVGIVRANVADRLAQGRDDFRGSEG